MAPGQDPEDIFSDVDPAAAGRPAPRPLSDYIAAKRLAPPPQLEGVVAASDTSSVPAVRPSAPQVPLAATPMTPQRPAVQPVAAAPRPAAVPVSPAHGGGRKAVLIVALFVLMLAGTAALGWYFYTQWRVSASEPLPEPTDDLNVEPPGPTPQDNLPVNDANTPPPVPADEVDSDADGLTDAEEQQRGTNPQSPDTDGDGLADREEVTVYRTDPKVKDTDGDGYDDGTEVQGGYNPTGPGKQLEIPQ